MAVECSDHHLNEISSLKKNVAYLNEAFTQMEINADFFLLENHELLKKNLAAEKEVERLRSRVEELEKEKAKAVTDRLNLLKREDKLRAKMEALLARLQALIKGIEEKKKIPVKKPQAYKLDAVKYDDRFLRRTRIEELDDVVLFWRKQVAEWAAANSRLRTEEAMQKMDIEIFRFDNELGQAGGQGKVNVEVLVSEVNELEKGKLAMLKVDDGLKSQGQDLGKEKFEANEVTDNLKLDIEALEKDKVMANGVRLSVEEMKKEKLEAKVLADGLKLCVEEELLIKKEQEALMKTGKSVDQDKRDADVEINKCSEENEEIKNGKINEIELQLLDEWCVVEA